MASPGELVRTVAEVLGVPEPTVVVHDRNLARAGLRTKGGRGRSAAKMTPRDAANLLIAVVGSSMVKDTVETVNAYAALPMRSGTIVGPKGASDARPTWAVPGFHVPALEALPQDHTFSDALGALIEAAADGSLSEAVKNSRLNPKNIFPDHWGIRVLLHWPYSQAAISVDGGDFSERREYSRLSADVLDILEFDVDTEDDEEFDLERGDLRQIRRFSQKTIMAIGDLLSDQSGQGGRRPLSAAEG